MDYQLRTQFVAEDDKIHVKRTQDVQKILDWNKETQIAGHSSGAEYRHVGTIPFVVIEMWLKESKLKLGSREFQEYVKKKLLSGDFNKLIAHGY